MGQTHRSNAVLISGFLLILGIVAWTIGRAWFGPDPAETPADGPTSAAENVDMTELKFLSPKEVMARLNRDEKLLLIDIRSKEAYDVEHIVDSVSVPATTLNNFTPGSGQLVVVIAGPEIPNLTLKSIHLLFTERRFSFAFLEGSIADWLLAGGSTISSGDPESPLDYSKVIFIEADQVLPLAETLVSPQFLDVRSERLFATSHLPGAVNIPLADLERRRGEIPRQKSLFVYGSNDYESYQGGVRLFDLGLFGARAIRGGFGTWQEKGLPVEPAAANQPKP